VFSGPVTLSGTCAPFWGILHRLLRLLRSRRGGLIRGVIGGIGALILGDYLRDLAFVRCICNGLNCRRGGVIGSAVVNNSLRDFRSPKAVLRIGEVPPRRSDSSAKI